MNKVLLFIVSVFGVLHSNAQYTPRSVFAHNDYVHPVPFYTSYKLQVGFIEADIFLKEEKLLVAHTASEMQDNKTLESLYLKPLEDMIVKNKGFAFADHERALTLMIDLKTDGVSTLTVLANTVRKYPQLLSCKTLTIAVSGNVPDPARWSEFPSFIMFDGRPQIAYTAEQYERIKLISTDFNKVVKWNGEGGLPKQEQDKIIVLRDSVHSHNKQLRFWGAPDVSNSWMTLMNLKIDIIGTDDVQGLITFIKQQDSH